MKQLSHPRTKTQVHLQHSLLDIRGLGAGVGAGTGGPAGLAPLDAAAAPGAVDPVPVVGFVVVGTGLGWPLPRPRVACSGLVSSRGTTVGVVLTVEVGLVCVWFSLARAFGSNKLPFAPHEHHSNSALLALC